MRVLHVLRSQQDERALATARAHARDHPTSLLLLHDALRAPVHVFPGDVYFCAEDGAAPGELAQHRMVGYDEVVRLIFEHDRVIFW